MFHQKKMNLKHEIHNGNAIMSRLHVSCPIYFQVISFYFRYLEIFYSFLSQHFKDRDGITWIQLMQIEQIKHMRYMCGWKWRIDKHFPIEWMDWGQSPFFIVILTWKWVEIGGQISPLCNRNIFIFLRFLTCHRVKGILCEWEFGISNTEHSYSSVFSYREIELSI